MKASSTCCNNTSIFKSKDINGIQKKNMESPQNDGICCHKSGSKKHARPLCLPLIGFQYIHCATSSRQSWTIWCTNGELRASWLPQTEEDRRRSINNGPRSGKVSILTSCIKMWLRFASPHFQQLTSPSLQDKKWLANTHRYGVPLI